MELTFDPVKHIYKLDGKRITSVTTILGAAVAKQHLMQWYAKTAAAFAVANPGASEAEIAGAPNRERDSKAVRGTAVHNLAEDLIHGRTIEVPEELAPFIDGYLRFLDTFEVTPILTEHTVLIKDVPAAGRFDLIATSPHLNHGDPFIADLKTSSGIYPETKMQLAAYGLSDGFVTEKDPHTLHDLPYVTASYVIHITEQGTTVHPAAKDRHELTGHYADFLAAKRMHAYTLAAARLGDAIPYPSAAKAA